MESNETTGEPKYSEIGIIRTETEYRFQDINNRFISQDKRIDDIKGNLTLIITVLSIVFGIFGVIFTYNYNASKKEAKDDMKDYKEELTKTITGKAGLPDIRISMYGKDHINGEKLPTEIYMEREDAGRLDTMMRFHLIVYNAGKASTGLITIKCYSNDPLDFYNVSTDEPKFKYEFYHLPTQLRPNNIPAQFTMEMILTMQIHHIPPPGEYDFLIKTYCENGGLMSKDAFQLKIK